jgi:type IV pilus assembly protein PilA
MKKKMNSKKGFTLVEIIVVLVILAIMAGFAIPAYNGFIERARESEILADARVLLIAAQTAGQEKYGLKGTDLTVGVEGTPSADETSVLNAVKSYSGLTGVNYTVTFTVKGLVTTAIVTKGDYTATLNGTSWDVAKVVTATAQTVLIR